MRFKRKIDGGYTDTDLLPEKPNSYPAGHPTVEKWIAQGNTPDPFVGPSALELWQRTMDSGDAKLPRWAEDLYDALPQASKDGSSPALQSKVAQKKLLRQSKPI